jgi:hypothetical protein
VPLILRQRQKNIPHEEAHEKAACLKNINLWTVAWFDCRCVAGADQFGGEWQF